jgi:hypothetical protein
MRSIEELLEERRRLKVCGKWLSVVHRSSVQEQHATCLRRWRDWKQT